MRTQRVLLVGLAAVLLAGCLATAGAEEPSSTPPPEVVESEARAFNARLRSDFKLPKMFDFARFKSAFRKHYNSALEEMVRAKLFMARAYRAFVTAVKYKYRTSKYYLSVNSRNDWTHEEIEEALNHVTIEEPAGGPLAARQLKPGERPSEQEAEHVEPLVDPADLEAELKRIHEHKSEPGYKELEAELDKMGPSGHGRRKRDVEANWGPRLKAPRADFALEAAYEREQGSARTANEKRVPSNNPDYKQPELATELSLEELGKLPGWREVYFRDIRYGYRVRDYSNLPVKARYSNKNKPMLTSLTDNFVSGVAKWWYGDNTFSGLAQSKQREVSDYELPDEDEGVDLDEGYTKPDMVWVDHREGGCMQPVQDQGHCGSCYAFASIAFFEWAHCNETGSPVKFSEQYILDCGQRMDQLYGCGGGVVDWIAPFVLNYGLELRRHYPYRGLDEQCPYEPDTPIRNMGYMRADTSEIVRIPLEVVEEYLVNMPLLININTKGDFHFYGGGVYDGFWCKEHGHHSVLLIGHGREDGEEYWLIRNSHSTDYGDQGHLKLNKNSNCIHPKYAMAYGNLRGDRIRIYSQRNWRVSKPVQKVPKAPGANSKRKPEYDSEAFRKEMEAARRREAERLKRNKSA